MKCSFCFNLKNRKRGDMLEFKVGDRVVVIRVNDKYIGEYGTIMSCTGTRSVIGVKLDNYNNVNINNINNMYFYISDNLRKINNKREKEIMCKKENRVYRTKQVVELWYSRRIEETNKKRDDEKQDIINSDENYKFINSKLSEIHNMIDEFTVDIEKMNIEKYISSIGLQNIDVLTDENHNKILDIETGRKEAIKNIKDTKEELDALLPACDTYAEEMEILKARGIVDSFSFDLSV